MNWVTENETLERILLYAEKQVSDRTNIIIAANGLLLQPFVMSFTSASVTGYFIAIPVIICLIGICLNTFLGWSNWIQISKAKESWKNLTKLGVATPFSFAPSVEAKPTYYYIFNNYAPILLITAWIACLVFFCLQKIFGIV